MFPLLVRLSFRIHRLLKSDGVVKSSIYGVVAFRQIFGILRISCLLKYLKMI